MPARHETRQEPTTRGGQPRTHPPTDSLTYLKSSQGGVSLGGRGEVANGGRGTARGQHRRLASVVGEVVVHGRSDCCNVRFLSGFEVWVSDAIGLPAAGTHKCGGPFEVVEDRASVDVVSCSRRQGRVVTLLLPGVSRTVMISELEVRGYQAVVSPPAPPPELPSQLEPTPPFTPPEPPSQYPPASASLPPSTPAAPSQPSWCASVETPTTSCSVAPEQVSERCTCRYTWIRGCSGPVDVRLRCFE